MTISSSLSSNSFQAFALPDPEESKEPWFEESTMLVPVLVGMDFIYSNGMIIDFHDGHTICAAQEQPRPFHLPRNNKGHYMVDLVDFLTEGDLCHEGHPQIHVLVEDGTASTIDLSNSQWVSSRGIHSVIFTHQFEAQVMQVPGSRNHEQLFASVIDRRMRLMNHQTGLMGSLLSVGVPECAGVGSGGRFRKVPEGSRECGLLPCNLDRSSHVIVFEHLLVITLSAWAKPLRNKNSPM